MKIGLIARCDNGGLGNLTWEFARHIPCHKILLKNLDDPATGISNRGGYFPERYKETSVLTEFRESVGIETSDEDFDWLTSDIDVVYTAEIPYGNRLYEIAERNGAKTVLHAMPELYRGDKPTQLWVPTAWEIDRVRKTFGREVEIVPVPVALDRFSGRRLRSAEDSSPFHFYHIASPAMLDRNGTDTLLRAVPKIRADCRLTVLGHNLKIPSTRYVTVEHVIGRGPNEYWNVHPKNVDMLVMPRRYAGLSMPVNEAAAAGRPSMMSHVDPQTSWAGVYTVPLDPTKTRAVSMQGGTFPVFTTDHRHLAARMTMFARVGRLSPEFQSLSAAAWARAQELSWRNLVHVYLEKFASV